MGAPSPPSIGQAVPAFTAAATGGRTFSLEECAGRNLVLYFYPRDTTPGCTTEGQDFNARLADFERLGTRVYGVSRDSLASHEKFRARHAFGFHLLSDPDEQLCTLFDVIRMKNLYGRKVRGIERSTFLIDADGVLRAEWRKVKVKGHVDAVLAAVRTL